MREFVFWMSGVGIISFVRWIRRFSGSASGKEQLPFRVCQKLPPATPKRLSQSPAPRQTLALLLAFDDFRKMGALVLLDQRADPLHECCQGMRVICPDLFNQGLQHVTQAMIVRESSRRRQRRGGEAIAFFGYARSRLRLFNAVEALKAVSLALFDGGDRLRAGSVPSTNSSAKVSALFPKIIASGSSSTFSSPLSTRSARMWKARMVTPIAASRRVAP